MSTHFQRHLWKLSLTTSAQQAATLIEALHRDNPAQFAKLALLGVFAANWQAGVLDDHTFLHKTKALVESHIEPAIRNEAAHSLLATLTGHLLPAAHAA